MKYVFLILICISCYPNDDHEFIDPALLPYYNTFKYEAERLGVQLPTKGVMIYFDSIDSNGHCDWNKRYCNITINFNLFSIDDYDTYSRRIEATIFHELGHGLLNRYHLPSVPDAEYEASLMTIPMGGRKYWINGEKREYYLKELFQLH